MNAALHNAVPRIDPRRPAIITPQGLRRIVLGSSEGERLTGARSSQHNTPKPVRSQGPFHQVTLVVSHAEDGGLMGTAVATAGEMATRLGLPSAPAQAEALAIARDIALAEMAGARLHFRQVTTTGGLALVRAAKAQGLGVSAGVTPAHFMISDLATADFRTFARLSPPLRCEADRQAVREALADGTIDVIASGHDPRGPEDKRLPFADAEPGMAGAETLLPLTLSLVRDGVIDLARAMALLAGNPARLLGIDAGRLARGAEADLVVIDPDKPWIVDSDKMAASAGNTPFDRQPVQGRALAVFKGGLRVGGQT